MKSIPNYQYLQISHKIYSYISSVLSSETNQIQAVLICLAHRYIIALLFFLFLNNPLYGPIAVLFWVINQVY